MNLRIYQEEDYRALSRRAANLIAAEMIYRPNCVLGLATGDSPIGTYQQLIRWHQRGDFSFREVHTINLDEYRGLSSQHPQSYRCFMQKYLFHHVDIPPENTLILDGIAQNPAAECAAYDAHIRALGYADLQLLGLGSNGHIGFNEPGDCFIKETHLVNLAPSTRAANARFFENPNDVPYQALTMGIGAIMAARRVLLIASGVRKSDALYNAFCGPISPQCPASILQLHRDVVVIADSAALQKINRMKQK